MYTNIPQDLLLDKICLIFQRCFNQPHGTNTGPKYNAIEVTVLDMDNSSTGRFLHNWNAAHPPLFAEQKQVTYTFNEVELRRLFYIMIRHTYIQFGDRFFHQIVGIPMGIGPAPNLANLFLGEYELTFMTTLYNDPATRDIFEAYIYCSRFIDDWIALNNKYAKDLLYENQTFRGKRGLYPLCLAVIQQALLAPNQIPCLDILLLMGNQGPYHRIRTNLYDKRLQPAFAQLPIVRFIPWFSNVNNACKNNIATGQFFRFAKVITEVENFAYHMARTITELVNRGYNRRRLLSKYKHLLFTNPEIMGPFRRSVAYFLDVVP
jgi:hypothetical protein